MQRMFILSPHIVDLDSEMLARLQGTRLRDVTVGEQLEDDADASDDERKRRDLEREDARRRRQERDEAVYDRRKAEIHHGQELRKIDRERQRRYLSEEIKEWKAQERAARAKFDAEVEAEDAAAALFSAAADEKGAQKE